MEKYVFLHGSSVGQTSFIPSEAPKEICSEIADGYFKGREERRKESGAEMALFVEFCRGNHSEDYVCYSFVINNCVGASANGSGGRLGQYFAISILCHEYVYPEPVYNLLYSAYKQLFEGKIINKDGRFLIARFEEKKDELQKSIEQIDGFFGKFSRANIPSTNFNFADYNSFRGEKFDLDICNSETAFKALCKCGRIYVSSEYESPNARVQLMESKIKDLQQEKAELEEKINKANTSERIKSNKELEDVRRILKEEKTKTESLQTENERYKESLKVVKTELEKYGKLGESIHSIQNQNSKYGKKEKKDLLKILLLVLILIFTLISSILSYAFFRNLPSIAKDGKTTEKTEQLQGGEKKASEPELLLGNESENVGGTSINEYEVEQLLLEVSNDGKLQFEATQKTTKSITITTNGTWDCPSVPDKDKGWIELIKDGDKLNVKVKEANPKTTDRTSKIMITSTLADQSLEKQITITQKKKIEEAPSKDYGLTITNASGVKLKDGDVVKKGDKLKAKVTKNTSQSTGWDVKGCSEIGDGIRNNQADISLTVNANGGKSVTISYGSNTNPNQRQAITLTVKIDDKKELDIENGVQSTPMDSVKVE